jgi:hypothetical protein
MAKAKKVKLDLRVGRGMTDRAKYHPLALEGTPLV